MYDNILVPTDGSTEAVKGEDHGVELAAAVGATVHALYVVEKGGNPWDSESMENQQQRAREYGEGVLNDVASAAEGLGVEAETAVEVGPRVHEEINEYVEEHDIDLIVMGSGYRGRLGGLLGSTAEKVLRSAEVPVTTLRRHENE
ncbi:universal stress protein [Halobacterium yunchengense]|uniref:universal stress protein n=1 Tax=Halobacterium yunchengense TaxID=3108497 RepID=UPI0030085848